MNWLSTLRLVPAVAPEAVVLAVVSFLTYVAALEFSPSVAGRVLDPLALALTVQLALTHTRNAISVRAAVAFRTAPVAFILVLLWIYGAIVCLGLFATDAIAAHFYVCYLLCYAATLYFMSCRMPRELPYLQGVWTSVDVHRADAVKLEAAGVLVSATTLLAVWVLLSAPMFALMMTFGVLAVRWFTNWIVVLYLLDAENSARKTGTED